MRRWMWVGLLGLGCKPEEDSKAATAGAAASVVTLSGDGPIHTVDPRFLSFSVDASQVAGTEFWAEDGAEEAEVIVEPYDFDRPALRPLVSALAPAMLRIGGTDADHLWYDTSGDAVEPPEGFRGVIDVPTWDRLSRFAQDTGLDIFFTLNAGPMVRDEAGAWTGANAGSFLELVAERGDPVVAWELGNELNAFPLEFGISVDGAQYAADLATLAALRDDHTPGVPVLGPSVAYWPVSGEIVPYMEGALREAGEALDVVTWHYYPQQSERCPVQSRAAGPEVMLEPDHLDELQIWADLVEGLAAEHVPHAQVWLGETGNAQCGGAAGVSDSWASTLWFLDQLGTLARRGQPIQVRQTLSGSDYGMLDDETLAPLPDYWGALLWRRLMGEGVLEATSELPDLRVHAHCHPDGGGAVTVLAINLSQGRSIAAGMAGLSTRSMRVHLLEADSLAAQQVRHNGIPLELGEEYALPDIEGEILTQLVLPPLSIGFAELPEAGVLACD